MSGNEERTGRLLQVRTSPHFRSKISVSRIMWAVIIALLPATAAGVYYFGLDALYVILTTVVAAVLTEYLIKRFFRKKEFVFDGSAVLTGLLLGLILPPLPPKYLWMAALGSVVAIAIAKEAFGGLGHNIFNPALVGRAFLSASFAGVMAGWVAARNNIDAYTGATPLSESFNEVGSAALYKGLLFGNVAGSIGETSALLLLIGGLALILFSVINWRIPFFYIGTVFVLGFAAGGDPLRHILAGGLFLGAFFMATDYVTSPLTDKGKIFFAVGAGVLTVAIRKWGGMSEGVCFSILLMNAVTPLIDRYSIPKPFGYRKPEKEEKGEKKDEGEKKEKGGKKDEGEKKSSGEKKKGDGKKGAKGKKKGGGGKGKPKEEGK